MKQKRHMTPDELARILRHYALFQAGEIDLNLKDLARAMGLNAAHISRVAGEHGLTTRRKEKHL